MSGATHTPGPWRASIAGSSVWRNKQMVAAVYPCETDEAAVAEMQANASLIAAAPALLDIARQLLKEYEGAGYCASDELIREAHAAIAKATGSAA